VLGGEVAAEAESRDFRRVFRRQAAIVLATLTGLTAAHFALAAGGLGWIETNVLFLLGLGLAAFVLLRNTRFAEQATHRAFRSLQSSYLGTVEALSEALDARDGYTAGHAHSVAEMVEATGRALGMSDRELHGLRWAALFHDIGKIGVPDRILNKPGPLDDAEWALMKRHPIVGAQILAPLDFLAPSIPIVRHEHEHWDGSGYPDGLAGEQIPLGARVILVCDAYHAMTSDRPYRAALDPREALRRLHEGASRQFDPRVVEAFVGLLGHRGDSPQPSDLAAA
jgi:putative nucleotidyltransferase with HDIG domain